MKKSIVLLSILCFSAVVGMILFWVSLNQDKTDIRLNENVLYGDSREAENLMFTLQASLYDRVFWKTRHTLGKENQSEPECITDFSQEMFHRSEEEIVEAQEDYFQLEWGYNGFGAGDEDFINKFIQENNISSWYSKTFRLQDEYAYYPAKIQLSLNNLKEDSNHEATESQREMLQQVEQKLASYFHVPVYDETMRLLITTDDKGTVMTWDVSTANTLEETISCDCIVADHAIWFTFSGGYRVSQMAKKYLSGLPGGAGVYKLPYRVEEGIPQFETDRLEQVYAISEDTSFHDYVVDEDAHRILIHTKKDGKQSLTVLSSETGACVQEISLKSLSGDEDAMVSLKYKEGAVLLTSENQLIVLEETEGNYNIVLDVDPTDKLPGYYQDFAWSGDKLAMFTGGYSVGEYHIFVYGRDGLLYEGKYRESLTFEGLEGTAKNTEYSFVSYDDTHIDLQWR